jgi:sucrose-phosphate synthase
MRVAFLNPQGNFDPKDSYWTMHPDFGGQLVYVKNLALELASKGHQVDIVTRRILDPDWPEFAAPLDTYAGGNSPRIIRVPCGPPGFLPKEKLWPSLLKDWVPNIKEFYFKEEFQPDVLTAHYADGGLSALSLGAGLGISFTFTGHSLGAQKMDKLDASPENIEQMQERFHFAERINAERLSMTHAAQIITSTRQEKTEQYGHKAYRGTQQENQFSVIPPGVNQNPFSTVARSIDPAIARRIGKAIGRDILPDRHNLPLVLASSRLDEKKNHLGLIMAFVESPLLREKANLGIVVRGLEDPLKMKDQLGSTEEQIMDLILKAIDQHQLHGSITAFPLNSQAELAAAYRVLSKRRSIFALTALYEPFGLAPLEAMSCGLPAVVTRNGGPTESMRDGNHEFAVLVNPTDPADIANGILRMINSPAEWEDFRRTGLQRVHSKYTWERTAEAYLQVFTEILNRPPSPNLELSSHLMKPNEFQNELLRELKEHYFQ